MKAIIENDVVSDKGIDDDGNRCDDAINSDIEPPITKGEIIESAGVGATFNKLFTALTILIYVLSVDVLL